jgi:hypothetical protein
MTVGEAGIRDGVLNLVLRETAGAGETIDVEMVERRGKIFADLTIGANIAGAQALRANERLSNRGVVLHGAGFIVTPEEATQLGLGRIPGLEKHIRQYRNGRDLTGSSRNVMVIDLFGLTIDQVRTQYPEVYQWVFERVKPERDHNNRTSRRENWWIFGEPISTFRPALQGLRRYIATVETSKHRFFEFLDQSILPDNKLVNIALDDAYFLGVLSSRPHVIWALATGSRLGVGNDPVYVKTACFEKFPFPCSDESQKRRIQSLGEQLDCHRKRQKKLHPNLTVTEMYNILEKLRTGETLNDRDRVIHDHGLISVLKQNHDELDSMVLDAYGWPTSLTDEEILARLVQLNAERVEEERTGIIRWLRPEYQKPSQGVAASFGTNVDAILPAGTKAVKLAWPKTIPEQARAIRQALTSQITAVTSKQLAKNFSRANVDRVEELLQTLVSLGQARETDEGRYIA